MNRLTADEMHVLLDVINGTVNPWAEYTSDPAEDSKASESGWNELLNSAEAKLAQQLNIL